MPKSEPLYLTTLLGFGFVILFHAAYGAVAQQRAMMNEKAEQPWKCSPPASPWLGVEETTSDRRGSVAAARPRSRFFLVDLALTMNQFDRNGSTNRLRCRRTSELALC